MKLPLSLRFAKVAIAGVAAVMVIVAWVAVLAATDIDENQELKQAETQATNLAVVFEEQVYRQILSVDQTLRILKLDWERDPEKFDFDSLQRRAGSLSDLVSQVLILDYRGHVVTGTRKDLIDADYSSRSYFQSHRRSDNFGSLTEGPYQNNNQWFLNISRRLNMARGVFAGVVVAGYDLNALMRDMSQADIGPRGLIMLVGRDGMVQAISRRGPTERGSQGPGANISKTTLHNVMFSNSGTTWAGPSPVDGIDRIHAFRGVPGQDMVLVVGLDRAGALGQAGSRRQMALIGAGALTVLVVTLAIGLGAMIASASERELRLAHDRAVLEAANLQLAQARERADQKSLQLGMTLAGMSDGISMIDGNMRLVQWNSQFADLSGIPRNQLSIGMPVAEVVRIQATAGEFGDVVVETEVARSMARLRSMTGHTVIEQTRPDGRVLELRLDPLPDGGWVTLYTDITSRKQAEMAQRRAREQAEIAAQEKSRFVAIVSHEIRTPLNVALNALALLDRSTLLPAQRQLVETGLLAGDSLMGLLNDILDLSRMQVGRLTLRPAPFSLRQMLEGVAEMFRHQAEERGVEIMVQVAAGVPDRLMTDPGRLRQALMNLVSNAAKFAEPGPAALRVGFDTMDGQPVLRLAVRDCGPEIPDLDRARLFRPFSQLERPQPGGSGTGLGLAICQLLANLLGGQIGCDPTLDGGKEFWLTLPADVMDVPPELSVRAPPVAPVWLPRTRVLLVEDVQANQMIIATLLRREGHRIDVASSGLDALAMAERYPYDIVLMDIFMPGIDGMETARRIRQLPGTAGQVPIVALTANVSAQDRSDYLVSGMDDLVSKPVNRAELLAALAQHAWHRGPPTIDETASVVAFVKTAPAVSALPVTAAMPLAAALAPTPQAPPPQTPVNQAAVAHAPMSQSALLDFARIDEWRRGLPASVAANLFDECLRQLREMVPTLEAAWERGDADAVKRVTHAMAGASGNYGLRALEAMVRAIHGNPSRSQRGEVRPDMVAAEIDRAEDAIRRLDDPEAAEASMPRRLAVAVGV